MAQQDNSGSRPSTSKAVDRASKQQTKPDNSPEPDENSNDDSQEDVAGDQSPLQGKADDHGGHKTDTSESKTPKKIAILGDLGFDTYSLYQSNPEAYLNTVLSRQIAKDVYVPSGAALIYETLDHLLKKDEQNKYTYELIGPRPTNYKYPQNKPVQVATIEEFLVFIKEFEEKGKKACRAEQKLELARDREDADEARQRHRIKIKREECPETKGAWQNMHRLEESKDSVGFKFREKIGTEKYTVTQNGIEIEKKKLVHIHPYVPEKHDLTRCKPCNYDFMVLNEGGSWLRDAKIQPSDQPFAEHQIQDIVQCYLDEKIAQLSGNSDDQHGIFIIVNLAGSIPEIDPNGKYDQPWKSGLWNLLLDETYAKHICVVCSASPFRRGGAAISRRLSWEQTVEDFATEMKVFRPLRLLSKARHMVIRFGVSGLLHLERSDGQHRAHLHIVPTAYNGVVRDQVNHGRIVGKNVMPIISMFKYLMMDKSALSDKDDGKPSEETDPKTILNTRREICNSYLRGALVALVRSFYRGYNKTLFEATGEDKTKKYPLFPVGVEVVCDLFEKGFWPAWEPCRKDYWRDKHKDRWGEDGNVPSHARIRADIRQIEYLRKEMLPQNHDSEISDHQRDKLYKILNEVNWGGEKHENEKKYKEEHSKDFLPLGNPCSSGETPSLGDVLNKIHDDLKNLLLKARMKESEEFEYHYTTQCGPADPTDRVNPSVGTVEVPQRVLNQPSGPLYPKSKRWEILRGYLDDEEYVVNDKEDVRTSRINLAMAIVEFGLHGVLNREVPRTKNERKKEKIFDKILRRKHCFLNDETLNDQKTLEPRKMPGLPDAATIAQAPPVHSMAVYTPVLEFNYLKTVDRSEIESFSSIRNLLKNYAEEELLDKPNQANPISLAVFGPPGSGKSFSVKQIARSINDSISGPMRKIKPVEFNISQMRDVDDLGRAFAKISSVNNDGDLPLAFFDEFDSAYQGKSLGWLKYFLAPMQDGEFVGAGHPISLGRAIFVFAGGIYARFKDFDPLPPAGVAVEKDTRKEILEAQQHFREQKGPDFISRLRGHIDILPLNVETGKPKQMLRRAILLRGIIEQRKLTIGGEAKALSVLDEDVIYAMLTVDRYRHGARSMTAIIDMCTLIDGRIEKGSLPSRSQLDMHVRADEFYIRMCRGRFRPEAGEMDPA